MSLSGGKRKASSLSKSPAEVANAMYNALEEGCSTDGQTWDVELRNKAMAKFLDYQDVPEAMGFEPGTTAKGVWTAGRILSRAKSLITGVLHGAGSRFAGVRSILHSEWGCLRVRTRRARVCARARARVCVCVRARVCARVGTLTLPPLTLTPTSWRRCGEHLLHLRRVADTRAGGHGSVP